MSDPVRSAALLPGEVPSRWRVWRSWLLRTFPGRALILGVVIKAVTWPLRFAITLPTTIDAIDMVGSLALLFAAAYGLTRFAVWVSSQECTIDISRAERELGYRPVTTREEGLAALSAS